MTGIVAHSHRTGGSFRHRLFIPSPSGMILPVLYGNADHGCLEKLQAAFWVGQVSYAWKYSL